MLGMLFGSYLFGWWAIVKCNLMEILQRVSDTFGRVKALMLALATVSLGGLLG